MTDSNNSNPSYGIESNTEALLDELDGEAGGLSAIDTGEEGDLALQDTLDQAELNSDAESELNEVASDSPIDKIETPS